MLRTAGRQLTSMVRGASGLNKTAMGLVRASHDGPKETDEQFDNRYITYFCRPDIDHWEARKAMNDILGMDLIPDPQIISAGLKACRKLNDYALATRWLEGCKDKCGDRKDLYDYISKEIRPTLEELGILSIEDIGYDCPELALKSVYLDY